MWRITSFFQRQDSSNRASAVESWLTNFFYPATDTMAGVGAGRAIANLPFDTPIEGLPDNFDAVAEFWFDNLDKARDALVKLREIQAGQAWKDLSGQPAPVDWRAAAGARCRGARHQGHPRWSTGKGRRCTGRPCLLA